MKKLLFLPLIALIFSCGENSSNTESTSNLELTYEIDTVMVDAGDHFFFLNWGLSISDVSPDARLLYNLNPNTLVLEVVDLDGLKLKETVQLEREGPNGVGGGFIGKMQVLANGNLKLFDFNKILEITPEGTLVDKFEYEASEWEGYEVGEEEQLGFYGAFSPDGKTYLGRINQLSFGGGSKGIVKLDMENKTMKFFEAGDLFERLDQFTITMSTDGNMRMSTRESVYINELNGDFVLSNSAYNEFWVWDTSADSLVQKTFQARLTSNEKKADNVRQVETQEALMEAMETKNNQVNFGSPVAHPEENLLWRIASDKDRMIADSVIKKQVLTLFDTDYNMLYEEKLEEYPSSSVRFFKDGMLYTFLNIDDEMAFVRLKPSISE